MLNLHLQNTSTIRQKTVKPNRRLYISINVQMFLDFEYNCKIYKFEVSRFQNTRMKVPAESVFMCRRISYNINK